MISTEINMCLSDSYLVEIIYPHICLQDRNQHINGNTVCFSSVEESHHESFLINHITDFALIDFHVSVCKIWMKASHLKSQKHHCKLYFPLRLIILQSIDLPSKFVLITVWAERLWPPTYKPVPAAGDCSQLPQDVLQTPALGCRHCLLFLQRGAGVV